MQIPQSLPLRESSPTMHVTIFQLVILPDLGQCCCLGLEINWHSDLQAALSSQDASLYPSNDDVALEQ